MTNFCLILPFVPLFDPFVDLNRQMRTSQPMSRSLVTERMSFQSTARSKHSVLTDRLWPRGSTRDRWSFSPGGLRGVMAEDVVRVPSKSKSGRTDAVAVRDVEPSRLKTLLLVPKPKQPTLIPPKHWHFDTYFDGTVGVETLCT